jgi:hypothetical protein
MSTHAENASVFRTIVTFIPAVQAKPRFISSNLGTAVSLGKIYKLKMHVSKI